MPALALSYVEEGSYSEVDREQAEEYGRLVVRDGVGPEQQEELLLSLLQFPLFRDTAGRGRFAFSHDMIAEALAARGYLRALARNAVAAGRRLARFDLEEPTLLRLMSRRLDDGHRRAAIAALPPRRRRPLLRDGRPGPGLARQRRPRPPDRRAVPPPRLRPPAGAGGVGAVAGALAPTAGRRWEAVSPRIADPPIRRRPAARFAIYLQRLDQGLRSRGSANRPSAGKTGEVSGTRPLPPNGSAPRS